MPYTDMWIMPNGKLGICCCDNFEVTDFADLRETPLKEGWIFAFPIRFFSGALFELCSNASFSGSTVSGQSQDNHEGTYACGNQRIADLAGSLLHLPLLLLPHLLLLLLLLMTGLHRWRKGISKLSAKLMG